MYEASALDGVPDVRKAPTGRKLIVLLSKPALVAGYHAG
jgi:hypothetical protein